MISSEVQRTLVKSPPELWSELSDPAALARHLGELGEIHIVCVEPEKTVEWAAENTTGTVSIQPSGWGTKVTLSATRELAASTPSPVESSAAADAHTPAGDAEASSETEAEIETYAMSAGDAPVETERTELEAITAASEPESTAPTDTPEPTAAETSERARTAAPEPAQRARRSGFFARLFGRRRREEMAEPQAPATAPSSALEPGDAFVAVSEALAQEALGSHAFAIPAGVGAAAGAPTPADDAEPAEPQALAKQAQPQENTDIAAELMAAEEVAAEEVAAEEVTAVLAAVLDRLGAAHHRPFSRS